jgi:hypothetical protein
MSILPRADPAASAGWDDLAAELERWEAAGRFATLWWRDDDAVTPTARLLELLRLADSLPLALAVIPGLAHPELAASLTEQPRVAVLQHGWLHRDRAIDGKKCEYPPSLPAALAGSEIAAGRARLRSLFGARALPVFVPPWNRIAPEIAALLPRLGFAGLSALASPRATGLPTGLAALHADVDLVAWREGRGFIGEASALGALVGRLQRARRDARRRPIGILTHHLVMDRSTAAFIRALIVRTRARCAVRWVAVGELLQ